MAKKRAAQPTNASELPGVAEQAPRQKRQPEPTSAPEVVKVTSSTLNCSVPFIEGLSGYSRRRVDVLLTGWQAERLKGILQGLEAKNAKLGNGRFVSTPSHAIQWIIENATG